MKLRTVAREYQALKQAGSDVDMVSRNRIISIASFCFRLDISTNASIDFSSNIWLGPLHTAGERDIDRTAGRNIERDWSHAVESQTTKNFEWSCSFQL
jgi:hypothetical protein